MQRQVRLPEIFDQIAHNTPVLECSSRTPPYPPYPPPPKIEIKADLGTLGFYFPEHTSPSKIEI